MKNVRVVITNTSVQKIYVTSPLIRSDELRVIVLTDSHMFHFEFCDADAIGREGMWIVKGRVWDKKHGPSLYELSDLLGPEVCLYIFSSLRHVIDKRIAILLEKVKMSGRQLILPKDVVLERELDSVNQPNNTTATDDEDIPF